MIQEESDMLYLFLLLKIGAKDSVKSAILHLVLWSIFTPFGDIDQPKVPLGVLKCSFEAQNIKIADSWTVRNWVQMKKDLWKVNLFNKSVVLGSLFLK